MTLHQLAAFHIGSNADAMNEATLASWRAPTPGLERVLPVRLELVGAGSRGEVDLDGFGPWGTRSDGKSKWTNVWRDAGWSFNWELDWVKDQRLWQVSPWFGYWNINRQRKVVQLQAAVMNVADPAYQAWAVPRILRAFAVSGADALLVGLKPDRFEAPTQLFAVPGGTMDLRDKSVRLMQANAPDIITPTATPGFREGACAILRQLDLPFYTLLQIRTDNPGESYGRDEVERRQREWLGEAAPLWKKDLA